MTIVAALSFSTRCMCSLLNHVSLLVAIMCLCARSLLQCACTGRLSFPVDDVNHTTLPGEPFLVLFDLDLTNSMSIFFSFWFLPYCVFFWFSLTASYLINLATRGPDCLFMGTSFVFLSTFLSRDSFSFVFFSLLSVFFWAPFCLLSKVTILIRYGILRRHLRLTNQG